jgi:prepilin-type processing-associated H-X9-DG protein
MNAWPQTWLKGIGCCSAALFVAWVLVWPVPHSHESARNASCASNIKHQQTAMLMYEQDYDDFLPLSNGWKSSLLPYCKNEFIFFCPSERDRKHPSYAYNASVAAQKWGWIESQEKAVTLFESTPGDDQVGGQELLPNPPRHSSVNFIGFADGHVKGIKQADIGKVLWRPAIVRKD